MERETAINELLRIADTLKEVHLKLRGLERERVDLSEKYREHEYRHYVEVCNEVDERGKSVYTNADRRRREVWHRLRNDDEVVELRAKMREHDKMIEDVVGEHNRLQDRKITLLVALGAPLPSDVLGKSEGQKYMT